MPGRSGTGTRSSRAAPSSAPERWASCPRAGASSASRRETTILTCGIGEVVCPGVKVERPQQDFYYLIKHTPNAGRARPGDDRGRPQPRRHAVRLRHHERTADRADAVHERRRGQVRRDHRRGGAARQALLQPARPGRQPPLRDRARRSDQVVADDRLARVPERDPEARTARRSPGSATSRRRRTSRSSSRPAPSPSSSRRSTRRRSRPRSARTRSQKRGRRRSRAC